MPFKCSYVYISAPHIGHWYTSLLADASARWREMYGDAVILVTGNDEHGMKIKARCHQTNDEHGMKIKARCHQTTHTSGAIL